MGGGCEGGHGRGVMSEEGYEGKIVTCDEGKGKGN